MNLNTSKATGQDSLSEKLLKASEHKRAPVLLLLLSTDSSLLIGGGGGGVRFCCFMGVRRQLLRCYKSSSSDQLMRALCHKPGRKLQSHRCTRKSAEVSQLTTVQSASHVYYVKFWNTSSIGTFWTS